MVRGPNFASLVLFFCIFFPLSSANDDAELLLKFKDSLSDKAALISWVGTTSPCDIDNAVWTGLRCASGNVSYVILDNMGLSGVIDIDSLSRISSLRSFSIINNSFDGPIPEINKLEFLKSIFLSGNRFSGEIPDASFEGMASLKKVYLGKNRFTGKVPGSLVRLPRLVEVSLEDNRFEGRVPDFRDQMELKMVNVANNRFEGPVPKSLREMNSTLFSGNEGLCGKPLMPCKSRKKIVLVAVAVAVVSVLALAVFGIVLYSRRTKAMSNSRIEPNYKTDDETLAEAGSPPEPKLESGKLSFVRTDRAERFELPELLRSSAEVLGSGNLGSSYKAVLEGGPALVVKRFRHTNGVGKEEFYQHMKRIGALSHPNLLPLLAFYYRKDEKLLISDFIPNGSLASHLHGNRGPSQPGLDWSTRLKIIKGVAKGLHYLYRELPNLTVPHGHLKSSNVLLDEDFEPLLSDYALVPVVNKDHAHHFMAAYRSPESTRTGRTTRKTDVWSLGVLILELLTGKFPVTNLKQMKGGDGDDLAAWVNSVIREEWTGEVFDKDMTCTRNKEGEMLKLLKIGMCCSDWNVEKRWDLKEAVARIEELKGNNDDFSSYGSDDAYSSRAMTTDDDFSFSIAGLTEP